jgi:hypothetical protein
MNKFYYAGHSYMGINFTYDSPCWTLHVFQDKKQRDNWVWDNRYNDQSSMVTEVESVDNAVKIAGRKALDDIRAGKDWNRIESDYRVRLHGIDE